MVVQVYELPLQGDGSPSKERSYVRLPAPVEPYVLRISIEAGSAASRQGILYTSFPVDGSAFARTKFHKRELPSDPSKSTEVDLYIDRSGVFEFYVEYEALSGTRVQAARCFFNVDPIITLPKRSSILDKSSSRPLSVKEGGAKVLKEKTQIALDGLVIQTVIAKWMGNLDQWKPHLDVTRDRGYNMLHFTPLQERGASNSPYSLYDQLGFADDLFSHLKSKKPLSTETKAKEMESFLARVQTEWGMLSMIDVVLNHTANNSDWLQDHPEAGYNVANSPHLEAALELDLALFKLSHDPKSQGVPENPQSEADVQAIMSIVKDKVLPSLRLWEYYSIDVAGEKEKFVECWSKGGAAATSKPIPSVSVSTNGKTNGKKTNGKATNGKSSKSKTNGVTNGTNGTHVEIEETKTRRLPELDLSVDIKTLSRDELLKLFAQLCLPKNWEQLSARFHAPLDAQSACQFMSKLTGASVGTETDRVASELGKLMDDLNVNRYKLYDSDVEAIMENCTGRLRYQRLEEHGPKLGPVTPETPLWDNYFTKIPDNARTKKHDPRMLHVANNGWIWNADPLTDFASADSRAYLRREVIAWGDCVKLRYGASEEDCPFLWSHMTKYVESMAKMFHGFRIDNCHSTPIVVGEKLLDAARRVNPNLYVCAELFTGSEETDTYFVKRLGLNSLIREAMNGNDPKDMSRLLYSYGVGKPVGSMDGDCLSESNVITLKGKQQPCVISPLNGSKPHAFMMDCTHDNEAPNFKRIAEDALSTGALVAFSWSAIGSNKGFDDFYGKLLNLVSDSRHYEILKAPDASNSAGAIKRVLNHLHVEMVLSGYTEGHLHQENDYIFSHRVHPQTHEGYLVISHCAFSGNSTDRGYISPIKLRGQKATYILGYEVEIESREDPNDAKTLKGLPAQVKELKPIEAKVGNDGEGDYVEINVPDYFPPGSVMLFKTSHDKLSGELDVLCISDAEKAFGQLNLVDLNVVLYRADGEERDLTQGHDGVYTVPGLGALSYCGFEGWMHALRHIMRFNDLGHPLCAHLREGTWAFDYIHGRLQKQISVFPGLQGPADWLQTRFDAVKAQAPSFMRPKYFAMIINTAYKASRDAALRQMAPFVKDGHSFTHALALTAVQMYGLVKSASLDPSKDVASLAAGLPHFTAGWARVWGRDVCISIRGLLLVTGQFEAAKEHILAFTSTLKHGLIPNLIDSIRTPRYNSRDSPFWFLQNVQDYTELAPNGLSILKESVKRRFPKNEEWVPFDDSRAYSYSTTVGEAIQEILQRHASGIHFREYNAGPALDMQMRSEGFQIDIDVDWSTGLIKGGSAWNCGTWMDKMGESEKAGTKGLPGTPRDGAPIEITGLLKSALRWLDSLAKSGQFQFKGVEIESSNGRRLITYKQWGDLLQKSFEQQHWVPADTNEDSKYAVDSNLINRRGIYKDVVGSGKGREYSDYQLRANFPIAMAVAPELFDPEHALQALKIYGDVLYGPLGVKTLDPSDSEYRPNYDNANDSHDAAVAKGRNYHQGPEWGWPAGYYLRALLHFESKQGDGKKNVDYTLHKIYSMLLSRREHMRSDPWAGLPELTNENGAYCHDSCRTQAWSSSTILDVLYDAWAQKNNKGVKK